MIKFNIRIDFPVGFCLGVEMTVYDMSCSVWGMSV